MAGSGHAHLRNEALLRVTAAMEQMQTRHEVARRARWSQ